MDLLRGIYTIRPYHPASLLIRVANPVSVVRIAPASHVIAMDGDTGYGFEASFLHDIRRAPMEELLDGTKTVADISYQVPDAIAGRNWMQAEVDRKAKYDKWGALGLGIAPSRNWQSDEDWFCFEFFAMGMLKSGRRTFKNSGHVTAYMLMSLDPFMS